MVNKPTAMNLPFILLCFTSCVQNVIPKGIPIPQFDAYYNMHGYNSLKGCPLTSRRDPGFTLPIFITPFDDDSKLSHCGKSEFIESQDVSCNMSFTSNVVETPYELTKLLTLTARVGYNKWGPPFSANQHFRNLLSDLKQNILVVSTAVCSVYDNSLPSKLPSFHSSFVEWIIKLNNTNDENIYLEFLDTYGTHFVSRARFGASVTVVHKINDQMNSNYTEGFLKSYASRTSALLFGVSETVTKEQHEITKRFENGVETTTFSLGVAIPYKGNSLTWLTKVQRKPFPIDYDLTSVEALFSDTFMRNACSLQSYDIDYVTIQNNIMAVKTKYCQKLRRENLLDDCEDTSGLSLLSTKLIGSSTRRAVANPDQCYEECDQLPACVAVTICPGCAIGNVSNHCQIFSAGEIQSAETDHLWKTTLFVNKMKTSVKLQNTTVVAKNNSKSDILNVTSIDDCYPSCIEDAECLAFISSNVSESTINCTRHTGSLLSLTQETGVSVNFLSPLAKRIISKQWKGFSPSTMINDWYNSACVIDNECRQDNSMCFSNRCLCRPGFFLSTRYYNCSDTCSPADLQNTFVEYPESKIKGKTIMVGYGTDLETCMSMCNSYRNCRSFNFRATEGSWSCLLYDIVAREGFSDPQTSKGWTHYQRTCMQSSTSYSEPVWYKSSCYNNADCPDPNSRCNSDRCLCNRGFTFFATDNKCHVARSCLDLKKEEGKSDSYIIQLPGKKKLLRVWCDMDSDNGGWLVFQRRSDGSVDFNRNWVQYEKGFGVTTWEFWLGLSNLHELTKGRPHRLRIDFGKQNGERSYANYAIFRVDGPETSYRLHVSNYSGNAEDSLSRHDTMKFSTYDRDNDASSQYNCARDFNGGWWFSSCHPSNLNGLYGAEGMKGIIWNDKAGFTFTEMKLKEV